MGSEFVHYKKEIKTNVNLRTKLPFLLRLIFLDDLNRCVKRRLNSALFKLATPSRATRDAS